MRFQVADGGMAELGSTVCLIQTEFDIWNELFAYRIETAKVHSIVAGGKVETYDGNVYRCVLPSELYSTESDAWQGVVNKIDELMRDLLRAERHLVGIRQAAATASIPF